MKEIDDVEINSIEELEVYIKENNISNEKDFVLGQLNEQKLVAFLESNCIAYKRTDFKKWKILSTKPAKNKYLIRLAVLIAFIVLFISNLIKPIVFLWGHIENIFADFPFLGNLLAGFMVGVAPIFLASLFWKKIKFLYHLYMN